MAKKHDNSTFENAADKAVMDDLAERRALGEDVFGDEDGEDAAAAAKAKALADDAGADEGAAEGAADEIEAAADGDAEKAAAEEGAKDEPAQEAKEEAAAEGQAPVELVEPVQFRTVSKEEFETQRKALRAEKNEAFKKLSAGEISEDQFLEVQDRVDDQLMDLTSKHALMEANEQTRQRAQEAKLTQIRTDAKKAGLIDYNDGDAAQEFDAALQFVATVKANAKLGFEDLADKAHEMVLAQRGLAPKPAAQKERKAPAVPLSLSRLPAAATPNGAGGVGEQLGRLDGLDFQEAIGRMPRQQRDAYLDS
jgi:hypothetical protein